MTVADIKIPEERIAAFCRKWKVAELALFGSVLRADFRPDSDIDVLVTFAPGSRHTLLDEAQMELELEDLFGRAVDMVSRSAVEASTNLIRRNDILSSAMTIYVR
jgi:predicted nucleotidyltransferase